MNAVLHEEYTNGSSVSEFLDDCRNDDGSQAHRISRNYEECDLPCQPSRHEAIVETGMCNRRWIIPPDEIKDEEQGRDYQHAPDTGRPEDDLREFHLEAILR